jgi:hypothetical protein
MTHLKHTYTHVSSFPPIRGPVLAVSCMDLRLLDQIVDFMDQEGLTNRYDQVIFAGASLGALGVPGYEYCKSPKKNYSGWKNTFLDHLDAAYALHHIKDVVIIEHRDCGAYEKFLPGTEGVFCDETLKKETKCHHKYAYDLKQEIEKWGLAATQQERTCNPNAHAVELRVHAFLMDLRGDVIQLDLDTPPNEYPPKNKKTKDK